MLVGLFVFSCLPYVYVGLASYHKNKASQDEYQASRAKDAAHACEAWRAQQTEFYACTDAYAVWRRCRANLMRLSENEPLGVICEHPTYRFQAQLQTLLDRVQNEIDHSIPAGKQ